MEELGRRFRCNGAGLLRTNYAASPTPRSTEGFVLDEIMKPVPGTGTTAFYRYLGETAVCWVAANMGFLKRIVPRIGVSHRHAAGEEGYSILRI